MKKIYYYSSIGILSFLMVVGISYAATSVGNNVSTGGTLTIDADGSGSDVTFYTDTAGEELLWDASENMLTIDGTDGANALQVTDGNVAFTDTLTVTASITITAGNLTIGNGTPTVVRGGEDAYVEGTFEVDGAVRFDGTLEVNGNITLQNDETIANSSDGTIALTAASTTVSTDFDVLAGNLRVGNGVPTVTLDNEDAYVEGTFEVDGAVRFDGTLEVNGNITLQNDETISNSTDDIVLVTSASTTVTGAFSSSGTGSLGWSVVSGTNTACNTTCGYACVFGIDSEALSTSTIILSCANADADNCLCAGAN